MDYVREIARKLKRETYAVYLASKDRRVPWYVRFLAVAVVAYVFSPIDLIPDVIPVLGYLDDLIIVPVGIWLLLRLIPCEVLEECRSLAAEFEQEKPINWVAAGVIVGIWVLLGIGFFLWLCKVLNR